MKHSFWRHCSRVLAAGTMAAGCLAVGWAQEAKPSPTPSAPRVYTNRENVRRIAVSGGNAAFATSGGVRLWGNRKQQWREWTMQEGLPSHNVMDVAFDPQSPDTRLWVLSADWSVSDYNPSGSLYLSSISLADGGVHTEAPFSPAPEGDMTRHSNWVAYRLRMTPEKAFVYARGNTVALEWDRQTGAWSGTPKGAPPAPDPRPLYASSLRAIRDLGQGRLLIEFETGFLLSDDKRSEIFFFSLPWPGRYAYGGEYPLKAHSRLMNLKPSPEGTGGLTFTVIEQEHHANYAQIPVAPSWLVSLQAEVVNGKAAVRETARRRLTTAEVKKLAKQAAIPESKSDLLQSGWLTDVAVDTNAVWFATYNEPGIHATGIARYDRKAHSWSYPQQGQTGIAANQINNLVVTQKDGVIAGTTNGASTYEPDRDTWRTGAGAVLPPLKQPQLGTYVSDPEGKNRNLSVLAVEEDGRKLWVRWREQFTARSAWPLGRIDTVNNTLETAAALHPELAGLSVTELRVRGEEVWILGEDRTQTPTGPVVVRWDRRANKITRYHSPQWEEKNIAGAFAGYVYPGVYLYEAADTVWIRALFSLFRYDATADNWVLERTTPAFSGVYPFADALWMLDRKDSQAPALLRWRNPGEGWQRLVLPPELGIFGATVALTENGDLWLGGLGILYLPKSAATFVPEAK